MSLIQPVFVTYDEKEREAYLSQLGNFSPVERSLFHKLCRIWEPLISYKRFISMISREIPNANAELMRLMAKLSKVHMGIIATKMEDGKRSSEGIIICEPGQQIFYSYLIEEEILDIYENIHAPFPGRRVLMEKGSPIPQEYVREMDFKYAAELYVNKKTQGTEIFALPDGDEDSFILTQSSIIKFLSLSIAKFRNYCQSSNFLALMATAMEMSLTELKGNISAKAPDYWKGLAEKILDEKENLLAQRKVKLPEDLFSICRFLRQFLSAQIEVAREKKARDQEKEADMAALEEIIQKSDNFMVPQELFDNHLESFSEKYGDDFRNFRSEFEKRYLQTEMGRNLPVILKLEGNLIHEDNIRSLFLTRVEKLSMELYKHYVPLMGRYIRTNRSELVDIFNSSGTFEDDIREQISEIDKLMSVLLNKPATVAEAFIQTSRKVKSLNTVEEMKAVLVGFFYPDEIKFKELQVIFNLNVKDMYQHAFLNFGILRQLILRITGRHESFLKKFSDQTQTIYRRMLTESALPESYAGHNISTGPASASGAERARRRRDHESVSASSHGRRRKLSQGRKHSDSSTPRSSEASRETAEAAKKRLYSAKERDDAWQEFSKSLKK